MKKNINNLLIIVAAHFSIVIINNIRNILNIINGNNKSIVFISIPIIISLIIFIFYIFVVRKKINNKYLTIGLISMLAFYNICNGILYSANLHTFFILFIILMINSFYIYLKIENFSFALIISFSITIIITMILGMLGLLKIVKYILPISSVIFLFIIYKNRNKNQLKENFNKFCNKELIIFISLFIVAIVGGLGRFVHIYDEYSHWAYDAKAVIYYDKLSTSQKIMSKTRSYAPIITCWHYIVAQYSEFSEQNLYIGLAIFISIFLMSVIGMQKNSKYSYLIIFSGYCSCFLFGEVYSFNTLYADLAFGIVFGASIICTHLSNMNQIPKKYLLILLLVLTLIKPSGCIASFSLLLIYLIDYLIQNKKNKITKNLKAFIIRNWKLYIITLLSFIIWQFYVKITGKINIDFYSADIRPDSLRGDLIPKLNIPFIISFITKIITSFDDVLIKGTINLSVFQILIMLLSSFIVVNKKNEIKVFALITGYVSYFILTSISIFITFSYYEASIIASFARYINAIHVALIILLLYYILCNIKNKKTLVIIPILIIMLCPFKNIFYFITDFNERKETQNISNRLNDKFKDVKELTSINDKVFIINQKDEDSIMPMWYARYYLFPRKVNASARAISWKIKTSLNAWDLRDWGITSNSIGNELKKYNFNYLYFYTNEKEANNLLEKEFGITDLEDYSLYKIKYNDDNVLLEGVRYND